MRYLFFLNPSLTQTNENNDNVNFVLITIPFIGEESYTISKRMKCLIDTANNCKVRPIFSRLL